MNTRRAACSCGQLQVTIEGDPSRIALCHCLACQRHTGAVISNQARFRRDQVTISGKSTEWMRTAESGNDFPAPTIAVWEQSRHPWVSLPPNTPPKRATKQG